MRSASSSRSSGQTSRMICSTSAAVYVRAGTVGAGASVVVVGLGAVGVVGWGAAVVAGAGVVAGAWLVTVTDAPAGTQIVRPAYSGASGTAPFASSSADVVTPIFLAMAIQPSPAATT